MSTFVDPEDPRIKKLHAKRLINRDIDQLMGICELSLQDGIVDQGEAEAILAWLGSHKACLDTWPASVIFDRLRMMLADSVLDHEEQGDLLGLLLRLAAPRNNKNEIVPASLPLTQPLPSVVFEDRRFCFTGVFDFGSREECIAAIKCRGGGVLKDVTKKLHYLVIGNIGSEVWKHTSFGNKIAKAVEYHGSGVPLSIISETHWSSFLR